VQEIPQAAAGLSLFLLARNRAVAEKYAVAYTKEGCTVFFTPTCTAEADSVVVIAEEPTDVENLTEQFSTFC